MSSFLEYSIETFNNDLIKNCKKYERAMRLRENFVEDFPPNKILDLNIDLYIEGKGKKETFCYRLEHELHDLGNILGSFAPKFGIYFSKESNDYLPTKRYGKTKDSAFKEVKRQISDLIQAGADKNIELIKKSKLCRTLRGKILFVYYPDKYLPIYDDKHLDFFILTLNILGDFNDTLQKQQALINWKDNNSIMKQWTLLQFQSFLFTTFWRKKGKEILEIEKRADEALLEKTQKSNDNKNKYIFSGDSPKPKPNIRIYKGIKSYKREAYIAREALNIANHFCEYDRTHKSFQRKTNSEFYTEPHHLIPMCCQENFPVSLDVEANIVSLCSNCHNHIHYGKTADVLVKKLFEERKNRLEQAGIKIDIQELLAFYK